MNNNMDNKTVVINGFTYVPEKIMYKLHGVSTTMLCYVPMDKRGWIATAINDIIDEKSKKIAEDNADNYLTQKLLKLVKSI